MVVKKWKDYYEGHAPHKKWAYYIIILVVAVFSSFFLTVGYDNDVPVNFNAHQSGSEIYVENTGKVPIPKEALILYLNGEQIDVTNTEDIPPGSETVIFIAELELATENSSLELKVFDKNKSIEITQIVTIPTTTTVTTTTRARSTTTSTTTTTRSSTTIITTTTVSTTSSTTATSITTTSSTSTTTTAITATSTTTTIVNCPAGTTYGTCSCAAIGIKACTASDNPNHAISCDFYTSSICCYTYIQDCGLTGQTCSNGVCIGGTTTTTSTTTSTTTTISPPTVSNARARPDSYTDTGEVDDDTTIYFTWTITGIATSCYAELNDATPDESAGTGGQDTDTGVSGLNTYYVRCSNAGEYGNTASDTITINLPTTTTTTSTSTTTTTTSTTTTIFYAVRPVIFLANDTVLDVNSYKSQVDDSFSAVRSWYSGQLGGKTFNLQSAIVYRSSLNASQLYVQYGTGGGIWYEGLKQATSANGLSACDDHRFYYFVTPLDNVWGGMVGAENLGCSYVLPGTASIPEHMGRLVGGIFDPGWPDWWSDEIRESQGGVAHEIAHGLGGSCTIGNFFPGGGCGGLPHSTPGAGSIMFEWWEFGHAAGFLEEEKTRILQSPFIS